MLLFARSSGFLWSFVASTLLGLASAGCAGGNATPPPGGNAGSASEEEGTGGALGENGAGGSEASGMGGGAAEDLMPLPEVARIMAIGDSVTRATCWRARLWEQLDTSFSGRFDFVGTLQSDSGCMPFAYDRDNQGYSSSLITEIVAGVTTARTCDPNPCPSMTDLSTAFTTATPDIALVHFGTNDVWNARSPTDIVSGYSAVVDALRAANPDVRVLVAKIIPMNVTATTCAGCTCAGCPTAIPALNTQIEAWAAEKATGRSPILVVDQYTGFDTAVDTNDGVHPNAAGSQKMAGVWFGALQPMFTTP